MGLFKKRSFASATTHARRKPLDQRGGSSSDSSSDSESEQKPVQRSVVSASNPTKRLKTAGKLEDQPSKKKADYGEVVHNNETDHALAMVDSDDESNPASQSKSLKTRADDQPELKKGTLEDGLYKGKSQYAEFVPKSKFGPIKASANIRSTMMTDYQPDVCKDYKQTGFCGFGDTCKFLHSREDYKAGWQLDKDWKISNGSNENGDNNTKVNEVSEATTIAEEEKLPFACFICKESFKLPIVTNCDHYFCEACFLKEFKKKPTCFVCNKDTNGVFKPAKNIIKLMKEGK